MKLPLLILSLFTINAYADSQKITLDYCQNHFAGDYYNFCETLVFAVKYDIINTDGSHCSEKYKDDALNKCDTDLTNTTYNLTKYHMSKTDFNHCDKKYNGIDYNNCLNDLRGTTSYLKGCECDNEHLSESELPTDLRTSKRVNIGYTDLNYCHKNYVGIEYDNCLVIIRRQLENTIGYNILKTDLNYCDNEYYDNMRDDDVCQNEPELESIRNYDYDYQKCINNLRGTLNILPKCKCDSEFKHEPSKQENMIEFYTGFIRAYFG